MRLPLHGEESVGHVIFLPLAPVKLLREHVSHGALQQVGHFDVLVSVKNSIQSFTEPTEAVESQSGHTQPGNKNFIIHGQQAKKWSSASLPGRTAVTFTAVYNNVESC